ncbi:MAG: hypothetical protein QXT45_06235 [Candidatus Bilamarchaeaceae archaeon]
MNRKMVPPGRHLKQVPGVNLGQMREELEYGPKSLSWEDVPVDLYERPVQEYQVVGNRVFPRSELMPSVPFDPSQYIPQIARDTNIIASTTVLDRGLIGRVVLVPNTPVEVINAQFLRGYLLLNPALAVGLTSAGTLLSNTALSNAVSPFNTSVLGVANYKTLRLTLNVTNFTGPGPVTFDTQTLDPVSGTTFITVQTVFSVTGNGNFYASLGQFGVDTDFRIQITIPAGTTLNASIGFVLKDGLEGTSAGQAQTIFIGQNGVTPDSGYPLLSGREKAFYLRPNTQLFAVTNGPTLPLRVFEL